MPRVKPEFRKKVLESRAFKEWWNSRKHIYPLPKDPFRAYMIDLSLYAKVMHKDFWFPRTNRADYPPVDFPRGRTRPKLPSRKELRRRKLKPYKEPPPRPMTPEEKEMRALHKQMSETFNIPMPELILDPKRGWLSSSYSHFPSTVRVGRAKAHRGAKFAALTHEIGHAIHFKASALTLKKRGIEPPNKTIFRGAEETVELERVAWSLAMPFLKQKLKKKGEMPVAAWSKRFALGTYLQSAGKVTKMKRTYID